MREEANVKLMELVVNMCFVGLDRFLVVQEIITIDLLWENIGEELNESGKIIYCCMYVMQVYFHEYSNNVSLIKVVHVSRSLFGARVFSVVNALPWHFSRIVSSVLCESGLRTIVL